MRVLHIVRQFYPAVGGLEDVVLSLAREQRRCGIDARVLTLDRPLRGGKKGERWPARDVVDGIPVTRVPWSGSARYPISPAAVSMLKGNDLLHVHAVDFFADFLALTAPVHLTPIVLSTHGGFFHTTFARRLKRAYFKTVTRTTLLAYARIFACSDHDAEVFSEISGTRLRTIDNGVELGKFGGAGSQSFTPVIAAIGRIASHKRLDQLIATFQEVSAALPEARLMIFGNDFDGTLPALRAMARADIESGRIRIMSGLTNAQIRTQLAQCSFIASASSYEGFGLSVVEGMSAGLIPIVSSIPSFTKIVASAGVGHCIDFSDPRASGARVTEILKSSVHNHAQQRERAIRSAGEYGWPIVAQKFRAEYEEVLGVHHRDILGVRVSPLKRGEAISAIDRSIESGDQLQVAFADARTLNLASRDDKVRNALKRCLVLSAGAGADIASYLKFGRKFPDDLNGPNFVPSFLDNTQHRLRIYLVGSTPSVLRDTVERFRQRWPRHTIVGVRDGYFKTEASARDACGRIDDVAPDLVLAALGDPKQDAWFGEHVRASGPRVLMDGGASFGFVCGNRLRTPDWARRFHCEWLYQFTREPWRINRDQIIGNTTFLVRAWRDCWQR